MGWFSSRPHSEDLTVGGVISQVAIQIQTRIKDRARRYRYIPSTNERFEIKSSVTLAEYIVHLDLKTCSCRLWQNSVCSINFQSDRRDSHVAMLLPLFWVKDGIFKSTSSLTLPSITTQRRIQVPSFILIQSTLHCLRNVRTLALQQHQHPENRQVSPTTNQMDPLPFLPAPNALAEGQRTSDIGPGKNPPKVGARNAVDASITPTTRRPAALQFEIQ
jgi:hypothetical protein